MSLSPKPRKRPHGDLEGDQLGQDEDDNDTIHVANDLRYRDHKRSRPVEWPLKSEETTNPRKENKIGRRNAPAKSPSSRRHLKTKDNRPSRFIEGSMKDRTSAKPPALYTGDESDHKRHTKLSREGDQGGQADTPSEYGNRQWYDAGIEHSRPSGMYRFGKAIVNAFNPIWHGIHGIWKDNEDEEVTPMESVLQQRQVKAEKAYAELKKAGFKGTKGAPNVDVPTIKYEDTAEAFPSARSRDSGIDVDQQSSAERKKDGHVIDTDEALMPPQSILGPGRAASPRSDVPSSRKSSLHVRKPSFQSLKKVKSHIQLSSAKKTPGPATPVSTRGKDTGGQALKKQPSKKELRLSKKVSDLESKLEHARRELRLAKGDAPPVPDLPASLGLKPFKPGALPSLPSGLVVDSHGSGNKDKGAEAELHTTENATIIPDPAPRTTTQPSTTVKPSKDDESIAALADILLQTVEASEQSGDEKLTPQKSASKKRKTGRAADDDVRYKPDSDDVDDVEWALAKTVTTKRKPGRPRKVPKVEQTITLGPTAAKKQTFSDPKVTKQSPKVSKPAEPTEPAAISPRTQSVFDPAKVDRAQLLKMRTKPNPCVPFGKLSDDVINLRKEFPSVTDEQLASYFTSLLGEANNDPDASEHPSPQTPAPAYTAAKKAKASPNHPTFAAINHSPSTPLLGRPRSISPLKSKDAPKPSKRSHSPPPAEENSSPAEAVSKAGDEGDEVVTADPTRDASVPPMPKLPLGVELANVRLEKALPKIPKEDYEWPEDVF